MRKGSSGSDDGVGEAYARLTGLMRLLGGATDQERKATLYSLVLRSLLHPSLRPYLSDPLRPLAGEFVSLDARAAALAGAALREPDAAPFDLLPAEDRAFLADFVAMPEPGQRSSASGNTAVGALWGALYVPDRGAAVPCRLAAVYDRALAGDPLDGWPAPAAVRPVSTSVTASAHRALHAALVLTCRTGRLPAGLTPAPVYFDVCAQDLAEAALAGVAGESLELPLALAFLSALCDESIGAGVGATGALAPTASGDDWGDCNVVPVGWVREKAAAVHAALGAGRAAAFYAPPSRAESSDGAVVAVSDLKSAAAAVLPARFSPIDHSSPDNDSTSDTDYASPCFVCAAMPDNASSAVTASTGETPAALLGESLRRAGGSVFRHGSGDGAAELLYAVFRDADTAAKTALAASRTLLCYPWPAAALAEGLAPGIAVHCGPAQRVAGRWIGDGVDQGARIAEVAAPGAVLISEAARDALLAGSKNGEIHLAALGAHRLRDLRPPVTLFGVSSDTGVQASPLAPTLNSRLHNLPVQLLPLFGRDPERSTLRRILLDPSARLVTLTGPGGCGKTRLALEAAAASAGGFDGGVFLVALDDARGAEDAAAAIASTLGLEAAPGSATVADAVLASLTEPRSRQLLVLDGADSGVSEDGSTVPSITAFVADLLAAAPDIVCLATARTSLRAAVGTAGETIFPVLPLGAPPEGIPDEVLSDAVSLSPAGSLFLARARAIRPGFAPTGPADWSALAFLCRRLRATPLALTLAAAQTDTLPLTEIAARFGRGGSVLETLWSLLGPDERLLLNRLSCFAGGIAVDAAEAVAPCPDGVAETLALLEEKGFLQRSAGDGRRAMPPPVREFAHRQLAETGGEDAARSAHARFFELLAARLDRLADSDREASAFDRLDSEIDNLRAVLRYLRAAAPERVPSFVYGLSDFLHYRRHLREWRDWPPLAVSLIETRRLPVDEGVRSHLYWCCATARMDVEDTESAETYLAEADASAGRAADRRTRADALSLRGTLQTRAGRWDAAEAAHREAHGIYREIGLVRGEVATLNGLAHIAIHRGDLAAAFTCNDEIANFCRRIGDRRGLAVALNNLGYIAAMRKEYDAAVRHFERCLGLYRELRDARGIARSLLNLSEALTADGRAVEGSAPLALAGAILNALRIRETSPMQETARRLANETKQSGALDRLVDLRQQLEQCPLPALLSLDATDPLAAPSRRLRLEAVRLRL